MHDVTELCATHDMNRPNFLNMAIRSGRISESRGEPGMDKWLNTKEKDIVRETHDYYYKENW